MHDSNTATGTDTRGRVGTSHERRDRLVNEHWRLVASTVRRVARRLPSHVDIDELLSAGQEGLLRAAQRYDASRGTAFSTFAVHTIRGAVLDALRALDPLARPTRQRVRRLAAAESSLAAEHGGRVSESLVAETAGLTERQARDAREMQHRAIRVSLDEQRPEGPLSDVIADPRSADVAARLLIEEAHTVIREEIGELGENDRRVVAMYYADGLLLREIAAILGVTEGRISQIHKRAIGRLRDAVRRRGLMD